MRTSDDILNKRICDIQNVQKHCAIVPLIGTGRCAVQYLYLVLVRTAYNERSS